jgi:hypothetical protein
MVVVDLDLFAKLDALDETERSNLLAFLGARDTSEAELEDIIGALNASLMVKQIASGAKPN